jgi:HSP20 family molecular chaperone IbpA
MDQIPLTAGRHDYSLIMPVPGHSHQSIHLDVVEGGTVLKISGKLEADYFPATMVEGGTKKVEGSSRGGRFVEKIEGMVALPTDADAHGLVAAVENGVLKVKIPR